MSNINDKMQNYYEGLIGRIRAGEILTNKEHRFVDSHTSLLKAEAGSKGAGNAGKRKITKTGK